jgi:UDP-N-acetylglucosamine--N-acetylmuramyl-(pentapeptide) pyrophosphoryl-undecaprenol N-acetylglucosamine transferase
VVESCVAFAAGGTAGHVLPALHTADALREQQPDLRIIFIGGEQGLETVLVPQAGYELFSVPAAPFPRRLTPAALTFPQRITSAVRQTRAILRDQRVNVVVGFGGYAAVPAYLAAWRNKVPLIVHEANAKAGMANKLAARFTSSVYATDPSVMSAARQLALPISSHLVRSDTSRSSAREFFGLSDGPVLLVFGGSQGAQRINDALAQALPELLASGVQILHAYGAKNAAPQAQPGYIPLPYLDRMDLAYAAADLAVCRAGAMTCAELTAVGLPAMYVPLAIGNGEQELNAAPIIAAGGGVICRNADLTGATLQASVQEIIHDPARIAHMGAAAGSLGKPNSAREFADVILQVLPEDA